MLKSPVDAVQGKMDDTLWFRRGPGSSWHPESCSHEVAFNLTTPKQAAGSAECKEPYFMGGNFFLMLLNEILTAIQ